MKHEATERPLSVGPSSSSASRGRLVRGGPRPMALEQRFMFDGAGAADAVETVTHDPAPDAGSPAQASPSGLDLIVATYSAPRDEAVAEEGTAAGTREPSSLDGAMADTAGTATAESRYFKVDGLDPVLQEAAARASEQILNFAREASDEAWFALFDGAAAEPDAAWVERLDALRAALLDGSLQLDVQAIDPQAMPDAVAAFAANGPDGQSVVFVNTAWTRLLDAEDLSRVLVEEFGHAIDQRLNAGADTAGDEGERFAARVLGLTLDGGDSQRLLTENDQRVIEWEGVSYAVETASLSFVNAYAMVYDLNNNNQIDNTERWADKEQNLHYFNTVGLGTAEVRDDINSRYFSGNDVSAIGIIIGNQTYYGAPRKTSASPALGRITTS